MDAYGKNSKNEKNTRNNSMAFTTLFIVLFN